MRLYKSPWVAIKHLAVFCSDISLYYYYCYLFIIFASFACFVGWLDGLLVGWFLAEIVHKEYSSINSVLGQRPSDKYIQLFFSGII